MLSHGDNTKSENNDDDGFGFFDDEISNNTVDAQTETTKAETAEVEQGFGFFEDAPSATNINTSLEIASSNNAQSASTQLNTATTSNNDKAPTTGVAPHDNTTQNATKTASEKEHRP